MKSSRVAAQQASVLHFFKTLIESFGASSMNGKSLLLYLLSPTAVIGSDR